MIGIMIKKENLRYQRSLKNKIFSVEERTLVIIL